MQTLYVGSGGLGDSVILSTKLLKILSSAHTARDVIMYRHFESSKRVAYEKPLDEFWRLVQKKAEDLVRTFIFTVDFYEHGRFWDVVPKNVFNTATGLTTKVDALCAEPISIVRSSSILGKLNPSYFLTVVADGGGGSRGLTQNAILMLKGAFPDYKIIVLGAKKCITPDGTVNLTGGTTLQEALEVVRHSDLVIGPDGILTYFSAIHSVPTVLVFHEAPLAHSYCVHDLPQAQACALIHQGYVHDASTVIQLANQFIPHPSSR
jgi:hypothetical protein